MSSYNYYIELIDKLESVLLDDIQNVFMWINIPDRQAYFNTLRMNNLDYDMIKLGVFRGMYSAAMHNIFTNCVDKKVENIKLLTNKIKFMCFVSKSINIDQINKLYDESIKKQFGYPENADHEITFHDQHLYEYSSTYDKYQIRIPTEFYPHKYYLISYNTIIVDILSQNICGINKSMHSITDHTITESKRIFKLNTEISELTEKNENLSEELLVVNYKIRELTVKNENLSEELGMIKSKIDKLNGIVFEDENHTINNFLVEARSKKIAYVYESKFIYSYDIIKENRAALNKEFKTIYKFIKRRYIPEADTF